MIEYYNFHRCLVPVAITFMAGLTVGAQWPGHWAFVLICTVVSMAGLVRISWRQGAAIVLPVMFCTALGYLTIQPWLGVEMPVRHVSHFADHGLWEIKGVVVDAPQWNDRRLQFTLAATELGREGQRRAVSGKVKVSSRNSRPQLHRGDVVALNGRLRAIRNFANPGGFDYARYMVLRGIRVRTYARKGSLRVVTAATAKGWQNRVDSARQVLAEQMDAALAGRRAEAINLLKALIIGQRDQVNTDLRRAFNAAGVSHVLAISGLHIGMVAAAAFGMARWLLCWIPLILARGWCRKGAAAISFSAVLFYAILAGMSPSTQRATTMVAVVLMGFWVGRRKDWLSGLALAALIILMVYPPAFLSISFQLSFTAVLAIVMGLTMVPIKPLAGQTIWWRRWFQRWRAFMWVSGLAILGTLPLSLYYFNQTSLVGLATNLVVVPLVGMVIVPAGLLGVLALAASPFLAEMFWIIAITGIEIILWVVRMVVQWPWASARSVTPTIIEILLYYITLAMALGWRKLPRKAWVVMGIFAFWAADMVYWHHHRFGRRDLRVTAIDVGQGSANLLQLPDGYTVLVDGGGFSDNTIFDVGERILAPLLWQQKIKRVDLIVLSHPNSDHLNGLLYILRHFDVAEIWSNHQTARTLGFRKWSKFIQHNNIKHTPFEHLPARQVRHGVEFKILSPPRNFMRQIASGPWRDRNNSSLVLQAHFGQITFLFTGDIVAPAEADLVNRHGYQGLNSTILMVPHHGSRHSSTPSFLQAVKPQEAIVSCGWHNRFGFPHPQVLQRLAAVHARTWRTDACGAVQVVTDGQSYRMRPFRSSGSGHCRPWLDGKSE